MNERTVFLAALEITDPAERSAYLDQACADDANLRRQVDALLAADARSGEFLDVPALRQLTDNPDVTRTAEMKSDSKIDLGYLTPSAKPGSLGTLAHYEVMQVLGQGGFGTVLRAFDEKLHRMVAIKVLGRQFAATSPPRKRFLREARAVAAIKNENVVQVYSVEEQPLPYIVMEFVDGTTLQDKMDDVGPIEIPEVLDIGRQIAAGLAAAHALGLIHRDIKPANILLEKGVVQKVKITDFGLARTADDASLTQSGTITGTPLYMSPEQAKGTKIDSRADLFSLGSVLYALACGHPPFRAPTTMAVLRRVAEDTPRPLQEIIPETPDWFVAIVDKLLSKDPADRFQTAQDVADILAERESQVKRQGTVRDVARVTDAKSRGRKISSGKMVAYLGAAAACLLVGLVAILAGRFPRNLERIPNDNSVAAVQPTRPTVQSAESLPATFKNSIGMEFVRVPKGAGWLGGGGRQPGETKVVIEQDFYLGKYEVTQEEWEAVTGLNPSNFVRNGAGDDRLKGIADADLKRFPVDYVSWDDCQVFIARLNKNERETGWVYRLPKGEEWEYACRGGPVDKFESAFDFYFAKSTNTLLPEQANFRHDKGLERTCRVGSYEPNALGLHDMHGNVWEWCEDTRVGADGASHRLTRGGGWHYFSVTCRAAYRDTYPPSGRDWGTGLRLARVPVGPAGAGTATTGPDRKAAEYVLSIGGEVRLHGVALEIQALADLPPGPFELAAVMLRGNKQVTDAGLAVCSECKNLTHLDLVETKITDGGLAHFAGNKNLVVLNLAHTAVSDEGLAHFQGNTNLTELWLGVMPKVTDRGMAYFKDCKKLTKLWLGGNSLTDKGVAHFKGCKNLLDLSVMNTSVTDQGLLNFQDCKNLKVLWLGGVKLTGTGLASFKDCHDLTDVFLDNTNFSNSWLTHLVNSKNLSTLSLTKTTASDNGLPLLKEFKHLKLLYLKETEITAAGIDGLKKALPECRIEWNNGVIEPAATKVP
ncbi:protein kinase domain-containing protein [Limnoglobus roseus]|uniref:non-specific serine/threonine protein kinase n=1 Tax=Limnoglobus roseus TaxID=2598579 RepID=A0A5C1AHQ6_9BACT|nr:protein kinase [Limnoglobus roseus]QEL16664.1 serine/threonine-protein kinase PknB [Limnoglobus roseus]